MSDRFDAAGPTGADDAGNEDLMNELRALAAVHDPVPPEAVAAARSAIAWRTMDAELAELVTESEADAGVRGVEAPTVLTFESALLTVEVEVLEGGGRRRLIGQLLPPAPGTVEIRHRDGTDIAPADEVGRFGADDVAPGPVSLRCTAGAHVVETDWFLA